MHYTFSRAVIIDILVFQVQHTGGSMPRLATLTLYVPRANQGPQDWDVMEGIDEERDEVRTYSGTSE